MDITDATEWLCPVCGAHTYVAAGEAAPANCWACGGQPLSPSADLHVAPAEPIEKNPWPD
jgi:hypothetical protein